MGTAVIGLVAALIGAAAGLIASYITARQQRLLEPNVARAQIAEYDTPADDLFKRFQRELASWARQ